MGIFTTGPIVGGVSGNIGGINFANPRGSKVVRTARRSSPNQSEAHLLQQSRVARLARAWRSLSALDKDSWTTFANDTTKSNRLGVARSLSGYQTYMQTNLNRLTIDEFVLDVPFITPDYIIPENLQFTSTISGGIVFTMDAIGPDILVPATIYGQPLFRSTLIAFTNTYSFVVFTRENNPTSVDITSEWQAKFGYLPVLGQFIAVTWQMINDNAKHTTNRVFFVETTA